MTDVLKHRFVSAKLDGTDAQQIQPSHWNDGHRFTGGAAGDILRRDPTDATYGAKWETEIGWQAYIPQWWIGGGLITQMGNHALTGVFFARGKFVAIQVFFVVGSDPLPVGVWEFGLPFPSAGVLSPATGLLTNAGTATHYPLFSQSFGVGNRFTLLYMAAPPAATPLTTTAPYQLAAGSYLEMRGNYVAG